MQTVFSRAGNTKPFWNEMNKIGLTVKANKSRYVLLFDVEDLNDYYAMVVDGRKLLSLDEVVAGLPIQRTGVLFEFNRVNTSDVVKCILVGISRAEGIDGLSVHVLFKDIQGYLRSLDCQFSEFVVK